MTNGPDDAGTLLAAIPGMLGFAPVDSAVLVAVRRSRVVAAMRVDLSDCVVAAAAPSVARALARQLVTTGAESAVLALFPRGEGRLAARRAARAARSLEPVIGERVPQLVTWMVSDGRYAGIDCTAPTCCGEDGTPLPAPAMADPAMRVGDCSHRPGRATGGAAEPAARKRASRAGQRWWARRDQDPPAWRHESLRLWRRLLAGERVTDAQAGKLVAALRDARVRDAAILTLVPGGADVADDVALSRGDQGVPGVFAALVGEGDGVGPTSATITAVWRACARLLVAARGREQAPLLTMCALALWWDGDAARAREALADVLDTEPGYRLAALLDAVVATTPERLVNKARPVA